MKRPAPASARACHAYLGEQEGTGEEQGDQLVPSFLRTLAHGLTCWKPAFATTTSNLPKRSRALHPGGARLPPTRQRPESHRTSEAECGRDTGARIVKAAYAASSAADLQRRQPAL